MPTKLYNKYLAYNELGVEISDKFYDLTNSIIEEYPDIDLYELTTLILGAIDMPITIKRAKRGIEIKAEEA